MNLEGGVTRGFRTAKSKPLRITYLYQYFKTRNMSGGTRTFEMARRLVDMGHQVTVVTADSTADAALGWRESDECGIRVHWVGIPYSNSMSFSARLSAFTAFARKSAVRASRVPADVIVASSTPLTIALPGVWVKKRLKVPMVFEVRDLWPEIPIAVGALKNPLMIAAARRLERFAYRHADRIVALSPGMMSGVVRAGYPKGKISVIPNSSDLDLFDVPAERGLNWRKAHPEIGDRPMVLYSGTLGRVNGVDWLVKVAQSSAAIDPSLCFVAVGEGRDKESVRQLAAERSVVGKNFFLMPAVRKRELPDLLSAATICTSVVIDVPEMWNNSANKFFDALAAGRPIALNHGGWQAEILNRHSAGLVLPVRDTEASARILANRLSDLDWLESAGAAARSLAVERFNREILAGQMETLIQDTVSKARD